MNKLILHLEGLAVFIMAIIFYAYMDANWWLFVLLLLAPDLSMFGYLHNKRVGAIIYNIFHTYILPFILLGLGFLLSNIIMVTLGVIWTAHIGMDRMFGFGLKYPDDFKSTHLEKV